MMIRLKNFLAIEWSIAIIIVISVLYNAGFLYKYSYLPPPFFYEPSDTYMDWFNTAWWGRNPGTYDVWTSIYPPLSFVFLKFFGIDGCYYLQNSGSASSLARDCDWLGVATIWGLYLVCAILTFVTLRRNSKETAIPRTICLIFGWPMLNCVERGNLILFTFPFFVLAISPLMKSAKAKSVCAAIAVNFKVYLIAPFMAPLLRRDWIRVEWNIALVIMVYLVSFSILGKGTPTQIFHNLSSWSDPITLANPLDVWNSTTNKAFLGLLRGDIFPATLTLGSRWVDLLQAVIPVLGLLTQVILLLSAASIWLYPAASSKSRAALIALLIAMVTSEAGAYAMILFIYLIMLEKSDSRAICIAIFFCYIVGISADIPLDKSATVVRDTYFRSTTTSYIFQISFSPFVRPFIVQIISVAMACQTIKDSWVYHHTRLGEPRTVLAPHAALGRSLKGNTTDI